jgi:hypothetical protein
MDVSPNEKSVAFLHHKVNSNIENSWELYLMIHDLANNVTTKICKTQGIVDDLQFEPTNWIGDSVLLFKDYYWIPDNERSKRFKGVINSYNLFTKELNKDIVIVDEGIQSFDRNNDTYFVITKNSKIYKVQEGQKDLIYTQGKEGYIQKIKVLK